MTSDNPTLKCSDCGVYFHYWTGNCADCNTSLRARIEVLERQRGIMAAGFASRQVLRTQSYHKDKALWREAEADVIKAMGVGREIAQEHEAKA